MVTAAGHLFAALALAPASATVVAERTIPIAVIEQIVPSPGIGFTKNLSSGGLRAR